jgi:hypothetical protein
VPAQLDPDPDGIGIYFDTAAQVNCLNDVYGSIRGFLIITHPSIETGISGWTCHVDYELPAAGDLPNAGLNCSDWDSAVSSEAQTWGRMKTLFR